MVALGLWEIGEALGEAYRERDDPYEKPTSDTPVDNTPCLDHSNDYKLDDLINASEDKGEGDEYKKRTRDKKPDEMGGENTDPFKGRGPKKPKRNDPKTIKDAWERAKDAIHKDKDWNLRRPKDNYDKDNPFTF